MSDEEMISSRKMVDGPMIDDIPDIIHTSKKDFSNPFQGVPTYYLTSHTSKEAFPWVAC